MSPPNWLDQSKQLTCIHVTFLLPPSRVSVGTVTIETLSLQPLGTSHQRRTSSFTVTIWTLCVCVCERRERNQLWKQTEYMYINVTCTWVCIRIHMYMYMYTILYMYSTCTCTSSCDCADCKVTWCAYACCMYYLAPLQVHNHTYVYVSHNTYAHVHTVYCAHVNWYRVECKH